MSGERSLHNRAEAGKKILRAAYRLEVNDPANRLAEIQSFLQGGGNLILYGNHIAYDDPVVAALFYTQYLDPSGGRRLIIPASHWHTDPRNNRPFYTAARAAEYFFNAEVFRMIQNYMVGDERYGNYTAEDAAANHRAFFKRLQDLRRAQVPTTLLIYPEGHRSETGQLQEAEAGLTLAGRLLRPSVYVPLAVHYGQGYFRNGLNMRLAGKRPILQVGEPVFQEGKESPFPVALMQNLARELPPAMRGFYG